MTWAGIATSSAFDEARVTAGIEMLAQRGIEVELLPGLRSPRFYLAAPDEVRLRHLQQALSSDEYEGVWIVRGGGGLTRILGRLDWDTVLDRPLIGFSDVTPLLNALARRGLHAIHGPVLHSLPKTAPRALEHLWGLLDGAPLAPLRGTTWVEGEATGRLVGGNATMLAACSGTPYALQAEGAIVLLEDIGEAGFRLDRVISQLIDSGAFAGAVGIALGSFTDCRAGTGWTVNELLRDRLVSLGLPIVADLPIGHAADNHAFRVGGRATLADGQLQLH